MTPHGEEHVMMLKEWVTGYRSEDDPELQALFEDCPVCREEYGQMRAVAGALDRFELEEREDLERADALPEQPGEASVGTALRELARTRPGRWWSGNRLWALPLAAALLLVISTTVVLMRSGSDAVNGGPIETIGGQDIRLLPPASDPEGSWVVEWEDEMPSGTSYRIRVRPEPGYTGDFEEIEEEVFEKRWVFPEELRAGLPETVRVQVFAYDFGNSGAGQSDVQRRSPSQH